MSKKGKRKSVSMRDYEYFALGLYMDHLNERNGRYNRTSLLNGILFGTIPPIPERFVEQGKKAAKEAELKRRIKAAEEKEEENVTPIGGGIFTF